MKIFVFGAGKVGRALAAALKKKGEIPMTGGSAGLRVAGGN